MDRLLTMQTFAKVVQHSSFTAAGDELGISRTLVSRHIADLEHHFGVRLLNRTTRTVTATEAGQHYYEFCARMLGELRGEEEALRGLKQDVEGKISILSPKWVGNMDLAAAIIEFSRRNPKVDVNLSLGGVTTRTHEFLERGFDVCILNQNVRDSQIRMKRICTVNLRLVASPEYLRTHGEPQHPNDLAHHAGAVESTEVLWRFSQGENRFTIKPTAHFMSNSYTVLCSAALAGIGIAMLPEPLVAPYIKAGRLAHVLPDFSLEERPLFAAYAPGTEIPRKVRSLLTFLTVWFKERPMSTPLPAMMVHDMPAERETVQ